MQLTQPETIQILRKRAGLNQGDFGSRVFGLSFEAGRTKMKNIELGRQAPTHSDLEKMAKVLGVPNSELVPSGKSDSVASADLRAGILLTRETLDLFPGLEDYVDMLNKAVRLGDFELIGHITGKMSLVLTVESREEAAAD